MGVPGFFGVFVAREFPELPAVGFLVPIIPRRGPARPLNYRPAAVAFRSSQSRMSCTVFHPSTTSRSISSRW